MEKQKNENKNLWVYITIFFAVIFVLLIITAFSQIKYNKSITKYKSDIQNEQSDKAKYQLNLKNALEENESLHSEVDKLNKNIDELKKQIDEKDKALSELQDKYKNALTFYEKLRKAEAEYNNGNVNECALILKSINLQDDYDENSRELYNNLAELSFYTASESLYYEGYNLYLGGNFSQAIDKFKNSLYISENEYFSDDCYYYLAYSEFGNGNIESAVNYMKDLINKYPDSMFKQIAQEFINIHESKQ